MTRPPLTSRVAFVTNWATSCDVVLRESYRGHHHGSRYANQQSGAEGIGSATVDLDGSESSGLDDHIWRTWRACRREFHAHFDGLMLDGVFSTVPSPHGPAPPQPDHAAATG